MQIWYVQNFQFPNAQIITILQATHTIDYLLNVFCKVTMSFLSQIFNFMGKSMYSSMFSFVSDSDLLICCFLCLQVFSISLAALGSLMWLRKNKPKTLIPIIYACAGIVATMPSITRCVHLSIWAIFFDHQGRHFSHCICNDCLQTTKSNCVTLIHLPFPFFCCYDFAFLYAE